jgi:adenylate cyclase
LFADSSSSGTWLYFGGQTEAVVLRRTECYLAGRGQIFLGCDQDALAAPTLGFVVRA